MVANGTLPLEKASEHIGEQEALMCETRKRSIHILSSFDSLILSSSLLLTIGVSMGKLRDRFLRRRLRDSKKESHWGDRGASPGTRRS